MLDASDFSILFDGSGSVHAGIPSRQGGWGTKYSQAPIRWVDTSNEKNKIGVIDESWLEKEMLYKFTLKDNEPDMQNNTGERKNSLSEAFLPKAAKHFAEESKEPFLIKLQEDFKKLLEKSKNTT